VVQRQRFAEITGRSRVKKILILLLGPEVLLATLLALKVLAVWTAVARPGPVSVGLAMVLVLVAVKLLNDVIALKRGFNAEVRGHIISPVQEPELWRVVSEAATATDTAPPEELRVTKHPTLRIIETVRWPGRPYGLQRLCIGAPLLYGTSLAELRVLLESELSIYSRRRGHLRLLVLRRHRVFQDVHLALAPTGRSRTLDRVLRLQLRLFEPWRHGSEPTAGSRLVITRTRIIWSLLTDRCEAFAQYFRARPTGMLQDLRRHCTDPAAVEFTDAVIRTRHPDLAAHLPKPPEPGESADVLLTNPAVIEEDLLRHYGPLPPRPYDELMTEIALLACRKALEDLTEATPGAPSFDLVLQSLESDRPALDRWMTIMGWPPGDNLSLTACTMAIKAVLLGMGQATWRHTPMSGPLLLARDGSPLAIPLDLASPSFHTLRTWLTEPNVPLDTDVRPRLPAYDQPTSDMFTGSLRIIGVCR
jgi:hypothetical protein